MKLLTTLPLIASIICFQASTLAVDTPKPTDQTENQYMFTLKPEPSSYEIPGGLHHYVEHMDRFMKEKFKGQQTVTDAIFSAAIHEGDREYFAKLPDISKTAIDIAHPHEDRLFFCMTRYSH
jgi:hypothetical protein